MSNAYNTDGMFTFPAGTSSQIDNCLESIECTIAFDVRDWFEDRRSAWIYGIIFGCFDDESKEELHREFHWDEEDFSRLNKLHHQWEQLKSIVGTQHPFIGADKE